MSFYHTLCLKLQEYHDKNYRNYERAFTVHTAFEDNDVNCISRILVSRYDMVVIKKIKKISRVFSLLG